MSTQQFVRIRAIEQKVAYTAKKSAEHFADVSKMVKARMAAVFSKARHLFPNSRPQKQQKLSTKVRNDPHHYHAMTPIITTQ